MVRLEFVSSALRGIAPWLASTNRRSRGDGRLSNVSYTCANTVDGTDGSCIQS